MSARDSDTDLFVAELRELGFSEDELAALLAVDAAPVPAALRQRVERSVAAEGRFERFIGAVAKLLDIGADAARAMLDDLDVPGRWENSPWPGVTLVHVTGGPAVREAITGFVRIERGGRFPSHKHLGDERVLVLQGRLRDGVSGVVSKPGDHVTMAAGTAHALSVEPGPQLIYLVAVEEGVDVEGLVLRPDDPRI